MYFYQVTVHVTTSTPANPLWFLRTDGTKSSLHPILALQTRIVNYYHSTRDDIKSPHHSELLENGWVFAMSGVVTEALILRKRDIISVTRSIHGQIFDKIPTLEEREAFVKISDVDAKELIPSKAALNEPWLRELSTQRNEFSREENVKNLLRLLEHFPLASLEQMAKLIKVESLWIERIFRLHKKLHMHLLPLVRSGEIPLMNAYTLTKLPVPQQVVWESIALTSAPEEFTLQIHKRAKELREAKRQERL